LDSKAHVFHRYFSRGGPLGWGGVCGHEDATRKAALLRFFRQKYVFRGDFGQTGGRQTNPLTGTAFPRRIPGAPPPPGLLLCTWDIASGLSEPSWTALSASLPLTSPPTSTPPLHPSPPPSRPLLLRTSLSSSFQDDSGGSV